MVTRMSGDEFIGICARIASSADAAVIARKIIAVLARPLRIRELELTISVRKGISLYPLDGDDVETLIKKADTAMTRSRKALKTASGFSVTLQGYPLFQCLNFDQRNHFLSSLFFPLIKSFMPRYDIL